MISIRGIAFVLFCTLSAQALPATFPTITAPVIRKSNSLEIQIQHRFKRAIGQEQTGTFSGGAGVNYRVNYLFFKRVLIELGYTSNESELAGGASYNYPFFSEKLNLSAGATFFMMDTKYEETARNFRIHAALSSHLFGRRIVPSLVAEYNGYYEFFTVMAGLMGSPLEFLHLFGEIGFRYRQIDLYKTNNKLPFTLGIAFTTYAHQFDLIVGNSTQTGVVRSLKGGEDDIYLGFRITRLFSLGR